MSFWFAVQEVRTKVIAVIARVLLFSMKTNCKIHNIEEVHLFECVA